MLSRRQTIAGGGATLLASHAGLRAGPGAGEIADDIAIARRALALHPGLYRYQSPRQVEQRLQHLQRDFAAARSLDERFLLLSAFTALVRCGHTHCNPYNQKKATTSALFERPTRLPFAFDWIDGRMAVVADRSGTGKLPRGTEILSIGGESAPRLLKRLLPYARADGSNDAKRVKQMAMLGTDKIETFDIFQSLLRPPVGGAFRLRFRTPDGRVSDGRFAALTSAQRLAARTTIDTNGATEPFWTWAMADGIATLTMPSWVMYNSKWDWQAWLGDRLDSLTSAKGLIIDLRANEGGNDCGDVILARLAGRDLDFAGYRELVRYRRTPKDLDPYLDTWDDSFRTIGEKAVDAGDGFFELGKEGSDTIRAVGPRLSLPVAALVGPTCSSATFAFARRAQESGLVRLFGEPTGGNLRGINGGAYFFVRLPGSGLEFDLPIKGYYPLRPQPDRGVLPNVLVRSSLADIDMGRDRVIATARAWIASA
ncbi:peptidase S41 [Sphingomonas sp. HDW15A]|nr:peptidase S41 [Sphingomonas sp. HDW15A]